MSICRGLQGVKTENVEKVLVFKKFLKGGGAKGSFGTGGWGVDLGRFDVQKVTFLIKNALWLYSELCFLCRRGAQFQKFHENKWSEIEKWDPSRVGDVKILPKWGRIHGDVVKRMLDTSFKSPKEATCSRNAHICNVF